MKNHLLLFIGGVMVLVGAVVASRIPGIRTGAGINTGSVFYATGTTNASTTVNTTSTRILPPSWSLFAIISNPSTSTISCSLDGLTAASSSAGANRGLILNNNNPGNGKVSFGYGGDIPYIGAVNCVANVAATVGVIYK